VPWLLPLRSISAGRWRTNAIPRAAAVYSATRCAALCSAERAAVAAAFATTALVSVEHARSA